MREEKVPGLALAIVEGGRIVKARGYGRLLFVRDRKTSRVGWVRRLKYPGWPIRARRTN